MWFIKKTYIIPKKIKPNIYMNVLNPQPITNLGTPYKNIDFNLVGNGTNYSGGFGSNEDPSKFGITPKFASNNVEAAAASALKGGGKRSKTRSKSMSKPKQGYGLIKDIKKKMKIISNKYKNMSGKKISLKGIKKRFSKLFKTMKTNLKLQGGKGKMMKQSKRNRTSKKNRSMKRGRGQKGGYHQFMGNVARSYGYSIGGDLSAKNLGLANPPPHTRYSTGVDNYNHFTGKGAQIWN